MEIESSVEIGTLVKSKLQESGCPDDVFELLGEDTVLAGGSVVKSLMEIYPYTEEIEETGEVKKFIRDICDVTGEQFYERPGMVRDGSSHDYDIYTTRTPEFMGEYLQNHGYVLYFNPGVISLTHFAKDYCTWLMRAIKPNGSKLDVIFTNRRRRTTIEGVDGTPPYFINREFDLDICKIWFDGTNVVYPIISGSKSV